MDRLAQLQQFVAQRPDDPFPRYALALEHKSRGDTEAAARTLQELVSRAPSYVPAYLMLGMVLTGLGREDDAKAAYRSGQEQARTQGNAHALSELTRELDALGG